MKSSKVLMFFLICFVLLLSTSFWIGVLYAQTPSPDKTPDPILDTPTTPSESERSRLETDSNPRLNFLSPSIFHLPWRYDQTWVCTKGNYDDPGSSHGNDNANKYAWDFDYSPGTYPGSTDQITAVADGTVVFVQEGISDSTLFYGPHLGNAVVIDHGAGRYSVYGHLKHNSVTKSEGDCVRSGEVIARIGESGYTFGAHLHFSINNDWWSYNEFGYTTVSGVTMSASFADSDGDLVGGEPRAGEHYTSDNYESINFALNQFIWRASSEDGSLKAHHAIDGNCGTRWSSQCGRSFDYIIIDLSHDHTFNEAVIHWERANAKSYGIVYWGWTGSDWDWIYTNWTFDGQGGVEVMPLGDTTARWVGLVAWEHPSPWCNYSIWELKLNYDPTASGTISTFGSPPDFNVMGDVSGDGSVNVFDALFILQYGVGLREESNEYPPPDGYLYMPSCDVSGDNNCNVFDALFIQQCGVGITNTFCP